jgi:hypothetical protein
MRHLPFFFSVLPLLAATPVRAQSPHQGRDLNATIADALAHAPALAEAQAGKPKHRPGWKAQGRSRTPC